MYDCASTSTHFAPAALSFGAWNSMSRRAEREVGPESLDVDVPSLGERIASGAQHRELSTAVGPVKVTVSSAERAVVPMELRAGIVEGHWTPLAARQASRVVAQMTPSEGEALLRELGNMAPSKSSLDRLQGAECALGRVGGVRIWCPRRRWRSRSMG